MNCCQLSRIDSMPPPLGFMMDLPLLFGGNMPQVEGTVVVFQEPFPKGSTCSQGRSLA